MLCEALLKSAMLMFSERMMELVPNQIGKHSEICKLLITGRRVPILFTRGQMDWPSEPEVIKYCINMVRSFLACLKNMHLLNVCLNRTHKTIVPRNTMYRDMIRPLLVFFPSRIPFVKNVPVKSIGATNETTIRGLSKLSSPTFKESLWSTGVEA